MSKLPLKVQVSIRDAWDKDDAPVQKALESLKNLLGIDVIVNPEWSLLFAEMGATFEDKSTFAKSVADCVQAWCRALEGLLADGTNDEFTDTLLDHANGSVRIFLSVSPKGSPPSLSWSAERVGFILALPQGQRPFYMVELEPLFASQLLSCFDEGAAVGTTVLAHRPPPADDWADVAMDTRTGKPSVVESSQIRTSAMPGMPQSERLPDCGSLLRPDELLLRPPYHLVVHDRGTTKVEVHCSHSPTLQLLAEYLKKWCRINQQDARKCPGVDITLHQSSFGLGLVYDRLTLVAENRYAPFTVSPVIVLSLVEGVLGYKNVSVDGSSWTFRRDIELKK